MIKKFISSLFILFCITGNGLASNNSNSIYYEIAEGVNSKVKASSTSSVLTITPQNETDVIHLKASPDAGGTGSISISVIEDNSINSFACYNSPPRIVISRYELLEKLNICCQEINYSPRFFNMLSFEEGKHICFKDTWHLIPAEETHFYKAEHHTFQHCTIVLKAEDSQKGVLVLGYEKMERKKIEDLSKELEGEFEKYEKEKNKINKIDPEKHGEKSSTVCFSSPTPEYTKLWSYMKQLNLYRAAVSKVLSKMGKLSNDCSVCSVNFTSSVGNAQRIAVNGTVDFSNPLFSMDLKIKGNVNIEFTATPGYQFITKKKADRFS